MLAAMSEIAEMQKITAPETAEQTKSTIPTAISSADGAKVLKDLDNAIGEYQEKENRSRTFIGDVARALGIDRRNLPENSERSRYATFEANNGTYLKAPNGKKTNLTPKQWAQVRTKAFKKWFGDWEKSARIEKLKASEPITVEFNNEYELNRDSAKQWQKDNLRGEYTNKDTGETIQVSKVGVQKVTSHSVGNEAHLKSIVAIPTLISNSYIAVR